MQLDACHVMQTNSRLRCVRMGRDDGQPDDVRKRASTLARTIEAELDLSAKGRFLADSPAIAGDAGILDRISSLEQTEREIKDLVASLSDTLTSVRSRILSLRQTLALVNNLPVEILQCIFFMGYTDLELPMWRDLHVRIICSVCRLWRAIATSQSELWTTVSLDSSLSYVRLCVKRAGTKQFDVTHTINMQRSDTNPHPWTVREVCPFKRWRSLSITLGEESASWKVFQKAAPHLSHLRKLIIEMYPCPPSRIYRKEELVQISKLFPNLTSLYILWLPRASFKSSLPVSLVDLRIDMKISESNLATIFEECSSLRRLWVSTISSPIIWADEFNWGDVENGRASNLYAPATLKSLFLSEDVGIGNLRSIVHKLEAPNLRELSILMDDESNPDGTVSSEYIANFVSPG